MNRIVPFLFALLLSCALSAQKDSPCTATVDNVAEFHGQIVEFCGTPTAVSAPEVGKVKGDPVYLNFGGAYPDHTFAVVIWEDVSGKQRAKLVKRYSEKELHVKGMVKIRNGKPELVVRDLKDIVVK